MLGINIILLTASPTLAQLVERLTVDVFKSNQIVAGSIPASRKFNMY